MPQQPGPERPIPPSPGGQPTISNIVGRDSDIVRAWAMLENASLRLNEPRRFGKTSVLAKMEAEPASGWVCVRQSFQGVDTTADMAARALSAIARHESLPRRLRRRARQFITQASVGVTIDQVNFQLAPQFRDDPVAALEAALSDVGASLGRDRLVLLWDEIPDMVIDITAKEGAHSAEVLLGVLRRFRQDPRNSSVRWLLTGSVGFHHAVRRLERGDALLNDLDALHLGPLTGEWAGWLAGSLLLGAGVGHDQGAIDELVRVSGGLPYLLHLVAKEARDRRIGAVTGADIDPLFTQAVNDLDRSHQATHFLSRIPTYYGAQATCAEWLLDRLAEGSATVADLRDAARRARLAFPEDGVLHDILDWLCQDHYLTKEPVSPACYEWRYPPLARIWTTRRL